MRLFTVVFYIFLLTNCLIAQGEEQVLAKAGKVSILSQEFTERFELTPWPRGENRPDSENPQLEFLYTLIAEKLLAQEAQIKGYDTSQSFRNAFKTIEKLYIRDALYKHEISSKVVLQKNDLEKAFGKSRFQLKLDFIKAGSKQEIERIYSSLKKGVSYYSFLEAQGRIKDSCISISFGELDESLENMLFNLKPGEFTFPIAAFDEWYIFRLVEKNDKLSINPEIKERLFAEARKITLKRQNDKMYSKFRSSFFNEKRIETDGFLFWSFADKVIKILSEKKNNQSIKEKEKSYLVIDDFTRIKNEFGADSLNLAFIRLENEPVSLKQFIDEFAYDGFVCKTVEPKEVRNILDRRIKSFIENELIAREGYKSGLHNLPEVRRSIKMWKENYLAQVLKSAIMDSVRTANHESGNLINGYDDVNPGLLVNIVEVLADNLDIAEIILDELKKNADIRVLAEKYSKRESTKRTKGEFGYFPVTSHGEIGIISAKMNVGEIYGPLKTDEGYSIFKVIGKKTETNNNPKTAEVTGENTLNDFNTRKYLHTLTGYTARLAKSYGVSINNKLLSSTGAQNLNLFAYRYMGFGGRIMAVPLMTPFTEWVKGWIESTDNAIP